MSFLLHTHILKFTCPRSSSFLQTLWPLTRKGYNLMHMKHKFFSTTFKGAVISKSIHGCEDSFGCAQTPFVFPHLLFHVSTVVNELLLSMHNWKHFPSVIITAPRFLCCLNCFTAEYLPTLAFSRKLYSSLGATRCLPSVQKLQYLMMSYLCGLQRD